MSANLAVHHRSRSADGVDVFYRESGDPEAPTLLLVHGFPTSSHMYRRLLVGLADAFHVVAPDLPGFGFTRVPAQRRYAYTFGALERRVPTLVIWGEHDPFFRPPGAEAFRRDNPEARVELLDTGHFALETLADHIMHRIREMYAPANDS